MKKCSDTIGNGHCSYAIYLPYKLSDGENKRAAIDKCLLPEIISLWEQGIKTTGNCCGHGLLEPFIGVIPDHIEKMKQLGYEVQPNEFNPGAEDGFVPKTKLIYGENKNNGEWM